MKATDEVFQKELAQKSHVILEVSNKIRIYGKMTRIKIQYSEALNAES